VSRKRSFTETFDADSKTKRSSKWSASVWNARVENLDSQDLDRIHFVGHRHRGSCERCLFATRKHKYVKRFPWLVGASDAEGNFTLKCSTCVNAKLNTIWATTGAPGDAYVSRFSMHAQTKAHKAALEGMVVESSVVPAAGAFATVLREVRCHNFQSKFGVKEVGGRKKFRKMCYCLAEAVRIMARKALRRVEVSSLHQDCRKASLSLRYRACDDKLNVSVGFFGQVNLAQKFDMSADGIRDGTLYLLKRFCTPRCDVPFRRQLRGRRDAELYAALCRSVELFDADAAPDEQLAGRKLQGNAARNTEPTREQYDAALKNLKLFNKDTTHAARRITSRTFYRDEYLRDVLGAFVTKKTSIAQRIQNSHVFCERFRANMATVESCIVQSGRIKNLRAAKHRHESLQKPLGRCVLFYKAVLLTAEQIANERKNKPEGAECAAFLTSECTEESLLQLALLAEAADENMRLVRFNDSENFDSARLQSECVNFIARIEALFNDGRCFEVGFGKFMCEELSKAHVLFVHGSPKMLGGGHHPDAETKSRVLARMQNWVKLAREVVHAEFADFELKAAFSCFNLEGRAQSARPRSDADSAAARSQRRRQMRRISQFLALEPGLLESEYDAHACIGLTILEAEAVGNREAWRRAIAHTQSDGRRRRTCSAIALLPALQRYLGYGFCTAGVEQGFAVQKSLQGDHRLDCSESIVNDDIFLTSDVDPTKDDEIIRLAQVEWATVYGSERSTPRLPRRDTGRHRRRLERQGTSETAWNRERRRLVGKLAARTLLSIKRRKTADISAEAKAAERLAGDMWTAEHDKEIDFQRRKQRNNFMRAAEAGLVLQDEISARDKRELAELAEHEAALGHQYDVARNRSQVAFVKEQRPVLADKRVYVSDDVGIALATLRALLQRHGLQRVSDRSLADVYIEPNLAAVDKLTHWCAMLKGGLICTPDYIRDAGAPSPSLAYAKAFQTRRTIWCSPRFRATSRELYDLTCACMQQPGCNWVWAGSKSQLLATAAKRKMANNNSECIAFVTEKEQVTDKEPVL
jgi:hypothetical protein